MKGKASREVAERILDKVVELLGRGDRKP